MKKVRVSKKSEKSKAFPGKPVSSADLPIVGFGASAGGLEAFTQVLAHLPANTGMAFVLVQHLDPKHESMLGTLVGRATQMPVVQAGQNMLVEPNHVYVIPPNTDMTIQGGRLRLRPRTAPRGLHLPVDHFLRSLAAERGSKAIGVILSGTASDGALGLAAIKAEGGITLAQSEESAKYSGMPASAIAAGAVDYVRRPEGIARELTRISRHPYVAPAREAAEDVIPPEAGDDFKKLLTMLRNVTNVDFEHYKHTTLTRRVTRRMLVQRMESLHDYLVFVKANPAELQVLYQDILINVTSFFRDPAMFRALKKTLFPRLLRKRPADDPIRIWVPGCSTGEEAYSLAITLLEFMRDPPINIPVKIFVTDISDPALEKARAGIYPANIATDVPPDLLRRYFMRAEFGYQVNRALRDLCVFARHNVTRDTPFSRLDLISCRNLLIYLGPALQTRAMSFFHYALKPTGYLLLGASETLGAFSDSFNIIDRKHKVYAKKPGASRPTFELTLSEPLLEKIPVATRSRETRNVVDVFTEADRIVLGRYAPTGVVVNQEMKVLQFRGRTGKYLEPEPGEPTSDLFRMAREGLLVDLRAALHRARKMDLPVRKEGVQVQSNGNPISVSLEVIPLGRMASKERHFLVLFEETDASVPRESASRKITESRQVRRLHQELAAAKQHLQAVIEETEANNEELKSANEEIQSSNEELQSTNEEMETGKEELQSANEELTTVNEELQNRNLELAQAHDDLNNVLSSAQIPLVMVDNDLRLRRFTPAAEKLLNLIHTDVGRPLLDIKPNIDLPDLRELLRDVIDNLRSLEREVDDRGGRSFTMLMRPYRTVENKIEGAVLALVDVTPLKQSLQQSRDLREEVDAIAATVPEPFLALDHELKVMSANAPFFRTFGLSPARVLNRLLFELGDGEWNIPELRAALATQLPDGPIQAGLIQGLLIERTFGSAGNKVLSINARRVPARGLPRVFFLAIEDISARRIAEQALVDSQATFSALTREATVGILQNNAAGECTLATEEACRMAGVTPREALGQGWTRNVHPDDLPVLNAAKDRILASGQALSLEFRFQFPDGNMVWAHKVSIRMHDQSGMATGFISALTDVTQRKSLEEQLRQSQKMEAIGRLAGGVAHDFNNMLTAISGYASQVLANTSKSHPARKAAEQISKVGVQAALLTRQLLAFSRKQVLRPRPVNLNAVLRDMNALLVRLLGENIEVVLALEPHVGSVVVDPGQIQQVILNLAINSRDAMGKGGRLTLATANVSVEEPNREDGSPPPGDYVTLEVSDTGIGIEPATRGRLFEPFFTTKPGGTGFGLFLVQGIVRQSGGTIAVRSEVGKGTAIQIYLPRAEGATAPARHETHQTVPGGTETVLLVEDAAVVRSLVRELLEQRGYTVLEARDGDEALSVSEKHDGPLHVLLTDLQMPRMGGTDLAKRIRRLRKRIKVIYMSGYSSETLHGMEKEANFLEKPFNPETLAAAVRKALDK